LFFSSRRRHTRLVSDWSSDVCSSDLVDEAGPIKFTERRAIHQEAPAYTDQSTEAQILITGIKVVDLLAPYARGGKIGLFGGAGEIGRASGRERAEVAGEGGAVRSEES